MIEKILKAVKSSNKKRGRNITIGAVVGMLLSCISVMGADDYLWLKYENGIKFSKNNGIKWEDGNPYPDNSWDGRTYINNIRLYGKNNESSTSGYGLKLDTRGIKINLVNNGEIIGFGITTGNGSGTGINMGSDSTVGEIINNGKISGVDYILGAGTGIGINIGSSSIVEKIMNNGVIYGYTNAIKNIGGTISNGVNYGLLISNNFTGDVVGGDLGIVDERNKGINKIVNYGLAFNFDGTNYKTKDEYHNNFGEKIETSENTIINVAATVSNGNITAESLELNNGKLTYEKGDIEKNDLISFNKTYILNGIKDTLKVTGKGNELNNAVINADTTAINMGTDNSDLTFGNTIINGSISLTGKDNEITIKESIINGSIAAMKDKNNTLNLIGNRDEKRVVMYNNTMNIFNNISGFVNLNIRNNVAFYEDSKITDIGNVNIEKDGILVLRIDSTDLENGTNKIIGHALYGATTPIVPTSSTNTTVSSSGGKLLLALNGAGNNSIINFGTTKLDGSIKGTEAGLNYQEDFTIDTTSFFHSAEKTGDSEITIVAQSNLPMFREIYEYDKLNGIYKGIISVDELDNFAVNTPENLSAFLEHLNDIYAGSPYSYSSELSRKSAGMFRDIVVDNNFKPNLNNWLIYGGLTHTDGGNRDTYYGENYYLYDTGSSNIDADTKITGAYILGEYGVSDTLTSGVIIGGNKLKSNISNGSKVDGSALYLGAYAKKYLGNLKVTGGLGFQYGDYDADRLGVNRVASDSEKSVIKYSDNYNDMTYDIYLNGRYSHNIGDNLFLEPYATLSYTYIKQDGANEGSKTLAIETDSKSFNYTVGKIGLDLKKNISHSTGKSTLSAGVSYTKILDGAEEEFIKGRFKGSTDFDILVAHKNQHSIGLNAKYALELESGLLFDIKGTYSVERDSHNGSGKNRTKGEWIVGTGLGYKF